MVCVSWLECGNQGALQGKVKDKTYESKLPNPAARRLRHRMYSCYIPTFVRKSHKKRCKDRKKCICIVQIEHIV